MDSQLKSKSLNLQKTVSENPEKIHSSGEQSIEVFLRELAEAREARVKSADQAFMNWVIELGARRNFRLGVK